MATFTGTGADEHIAPGDLSPTVTSSSGSPPTIAADTIHAGGGRDSIGASGGNDTIDGGKGFDTFTKGFGGDVGISGKAGHVLVSGSGYIDDLIHVERLVVNTDNDGEDSDHIDIGNLAGTSLRDIRIDLGDGSGGDGFQDTVTARGTRAADHIHIESTGTTVAIKGLPEQILAFNYDVGVDQIELFAGKGNDRIDASKMTINSGQVRLQGDAGNDVIDGSAGDDVLIGSSGRDVLRGGKGEDYLVGETFDVGTTSFSVDRMKGGANADTFVLFTSENTKADRILDFKHGEDTIRFMNGIGTAGADVEASDFHIGTKAETSDQHVIYNPDTGALYVDKDGADGDAQIKVAILQKHLDLTYEDFGLVL